MEFSIATLLANFHDDKLVAAKVLEKKLDCLEDTSLTKLHITLEVLEKIGILAKERGKYRRLPEEGVIEAKLRCSSKGFCFAIQDEEGAEDIYIRESHLSTAWNGDRVLVRLTKEGSRRRSPEGEVRLILERANHSLLARLKQTEKGFRAVPLDDRLLFEIDLAPSDINLTEAIEHLIHVEILRYPLGQSPPLGRVVQVLGGSAEAAADIDLVCCKHDLPRSFSESLLAAAANLPSQITKTEIKQRLDLRSLLTIAIVTQERADAACIENALTLEKTSEGRWRLGIHITDVAHYILTDSPLDKEALKRGSSVYLRDTVLPLFPEAVQERCSLIAGSDRLAMSVLLILDSNTGQIVEFEIQPTVIAVDQHISEQQTQAIIKAQQAALNGQQEPTEPTSNELPTAVVELIRQLSAISQAAQTQRHQRGSFELKLPQEDYPYYDEGSLGVVVADDAPVKSLLTELLLLGNQAIAQHLQTLEIPAIYRTQPAPDSEDVQEMIKLASNLGVELQLEQEDNISSADFQAFTEQFAQVPDSEQVLTYLLQATLKPSVYSVAPQSHFGLALPTYARGNSPLWRYADLLLQRVLHTLFEQGRDRRTTRAKERVNLRHSSAHGNVTWNVLPPDIQQELETDLARLVVQLNDREKEVQEAEEDLAGLQKAQLMKQRTGEVFQGLITGVQSYGFFVEITVPDANGKQLRVEGLVHVSSLKDDWYEYRARQQALFGRKSRTAYRLGDRVAVQVKNVDYYRQQIDLVTVNGDAEGDLLQDEGLLEDNDDDFNSDLEDLNSDSDFYLDEE
ncbi:ribonuclease R family protein [Gloeocapsopsis sp. IPPAS B-1203]|uniref:ribonuclease R family protein n=1 Tax=Gloeocapsopsis sp. IPPAS B-1203 TaxID=2049454 RepID=UPI000C1840A4|nr:ribonuclease R family protein [Gloeocapsopsis sp. IPPAS B-1203]PIG92155.1 iron ABC transporter substrate-binding protein [Gloeocapsopsis sp. IPPAS B-1203]